MADRDPPAVIATDEEYDPNRGLDLDHPRVVAMLATPGTTRAAAIAYFQRERARRGQPRPGPER